MWRGARTLAQAVNDKLLTISPHSLSSRVAYGALFRIRQALIRVADPLVSYKIGQFLIRLPLSHNLPHFLRAFPQYSQNLGRIAGLVESLRPDLAIVDVGANVGDSVAILRSHTEVPVLAIEGNPRFFAVLEQNAAHLGSDLHLVSAMVGAEADHRRGGMSEHSGTSYYVGNAARPTQIAFKALSMIIDNADEIAGRKLLIKLDTDGFDCMIIKAEDQLLRNRRPILFFEYDPNSFQRYGDDGFAVFAALRRAAYSSLLVYENTGELRAAIGLDQTAELEAMAESYASRRSERYADICAFHETDADVFELVRASETQFFKSRMLDVGPVKGTAG